MPFHGRLVHRAGFLSFMVGKCLWRDCRVWPLSQLRLFKRLSRSAPPVWTKFKDHRLSLVLSHALREIPFFGDLSRGLEELAREQPMEALRLFPVLRKREQQENGDRLMARGVHGGRIHAKRTSGSTGEPTRFWHDHSRDAIRLLGTYRDKMYTGWRPGDAVALIDSSLGMFWRTTPVYRFLNALSGTYMGLNTQHMTREGNEAFLRLLERRRPPFLRCIASAAYEFARCIEVDDAIDRARRLNMRAVICSCETLYPFQRECIEHVFGCRVFNLYGSREMDVIAMECAAHRGLHVSADNVLVEVLDESDQPVRAGQRGRIVVTDLWNLGFGLIRYDLGDEGSYLAPDEEPCPCGVTFPRLAGVEGCITDFLALRDGTRSHGGSLAGEILSVPGVRGLKIVQETVDDFRLWIVGDSELVVGKAEELMHKFAPEARVRVCFCDEIPRTRGGKRAFVVSNVGRVGVGLDLQGPGRRMP